MCPNNHFFDAIYNACAAAHYNGMRLMDEAPPKKKERLTLEQMAMQAKLAEYRLPPRHRW